MNHIDSLYGLFCPIITFDFQSYLLYMAFSFAKCFANCPFVLISYFYATCVLYCFVKTFLHPMVLLILLSLSSHPSPSPLPHRACLCSVHGPDSAFLTPLAIPVLKFQAEAKFPDGSQKSLCYSSPHRITSVSFGGASKLTLIIFDYPFCGGCQLTQRVDWPSNKATS